MMSDENGGTPQRPVSEVVWECLEEADRLRQRFEAEKGRDLDEMTRALGVHMSIEVLQTGRRLKRDPRRTFKAWLKSYAAGQERQMALARAFAADNSGQLPEGFPDDWRDGDFERACLILKSKGGKRAAEEAWAHEEVTE